MKRIISAVLCALMVLSAVSYTAFGSLAAGISTMPAEEDVISIIGAMEIMNGDSYGNLNLDKNVTRAEFTKMALCTSVLKDKANTGSSIALFTDVRASHWAAGYVTTAVENSYIKGYLDGTFRPDKEVTLEEAVTIMLRIMGYSELDSGKYPDAQLAKYKELEMGNRIYAARGEALTRRECMYLMYNALCAKDKTGKTYCESLGYASDGNGRIDYLALMQSKMDGPHIVTDANTLSEKLPAGIDSWKFRHGTKSVTSDYIKPNDVFYYSEPLRSVWIYRDTATGFVNAVSPSRDNPTSVNVGGKNYTLEGAQIKQQFSNFGTYDVDDFVTLLLGNSGTAVLATDGDILGYAADNDDGVSYADLVNASMKGPVVVKGSSWQSEIPFDLSTARFYKKNSEVTSTAVQQYDVLYYSKALESVWIYSDKVTGTFEGVSPNRISPASVTVAGNTYALESSAASFAVSNLGSFNFGDSITLLLGKNGGAVEVISGAEKSGSVYGFITAFTEKEYKRANGTSYTADSIEILGVDTVTYVYEHEKLGFDKGDFVVCTFDGGEAVIKSVANSVSSAMATRVNTLISSGSFADDAMILDVYITSDSDSLVNKSVDYVKIYPSRLGNVKLTSSDIYYVNIEGDLIDTLILKNYTGDIHKYGIVSADRLGQGIGKEYIFDGKTANISVNTAYGVPSVGPARFVLKGGKYIVTALEYVDVDKNGIGFGTVTSGGKTYSVASPVQYYIRSNTREFTLCTREDILSGDYKIKAYYDKEENKGGRIRIIVAE